MSKDAYGSTVYVDPVLSTVPGKEMNQPKGNKATLKRIFMHFGDDSGKYVNWIYLSPISSVNKKTRGPDFMTKSCLTLETHAYVFTLRATTRTTYMVPFP
jgi:hypothetical protein